MLSDTGKKRISRMSTGLHNAARLPGYSGLRLGSSASRMTLFCAWGQGKRRTSRTSEPCSTVSSVLFSLPKSRQPMSLHLLFSKKTGASKWNMLCVIKLLADAQ